MAKIGGNPQNLKNFPKGVSGNPNGRPVGSLGRATILRKWIEAKENYKNPITKELQELTQADIITLSLINEARKGNVIAYREIMDSMYGKMKDTQEIVLNKGANGILVDDE